jgi:hypothetical protein
LQISGACSALLLMQNSLVSMSFFKLGFSSILRPSLSIFFYQPISLRHSLNRIA